MQKDALFKIGYGLYVLSTNYENFDNACIINSFMQIASNPDKIAFSVNKGNYTSELIQKSKKANVSVLSDIATFETFEHFGYQSGRNVNKFADFKDVERSSNGILYITKNTNAYFSLSIEKELEFASHVLFIADINDAKVLSEDKTLTYDFYQSNIKPKPKSEKKTGWICKICNYVYEGENLPADYICPLCKHPASDFVKL